jgi:hypothetical protein
MINTNTTPALISAFSGQGNSQTWLAITPSATQSKPNPQAGKTAAFQAKNIVVTGNNR